MFAKTMTTVKTRWATLRQGRPWLLPLVIILIVLLVGAILLAVIHKKPAPAAPAKTVPHVEVAPLSQLVSEARLTQTAVFKPAKSASLISRTGGRVTAMAAQVGDHVKAGTTIAQIDGGTEPSVARVQALGASAALQAFAAIKQQALASADNAISIAQANYQSAQANTPLSAATAAKSRQLADVGVQQAQFAVSDAQDKGVDPLIRSANLALESAQLAQDQATLTRNLAANQATDAQNLSAKNLEAAQLAKEKLVADLASQRIGLTTQLNVAAEQIRLAQVLAPLSGEITSLKLKVGDFLQPGQTIGEVNALAGAQVTINVNEGVRSQLTEGQTIPLHFESQEFWGTITNLSTLPDSVTGQWQVDIFVGSTPEPIQPGALVSVDIPVAPTSSDHTFIPLDATTVRQNGVTIFTVDADNIVHEHVIQVFGYEGADVEAKVDVPADALVVVKNNRNLRDGDSVKR